MPILRTAVTFAVELREASLSLLRDRSFAILAVGTLMVGIGITTAMLTLMDAILFRPPSHVAEPDDVVRVQFRFEGALVGSTHYPNFVDLRASGAFAAISAYAVRSVSVGSGPGATLINAMLVSREFFDVLQPTPRLGTLFLGDRAVSDDGDWVIVSYGFWQRHFGGEQGVVGATIRIDERIYSVAGVTPRGFQSLSARPIDVWLPLEHVSGVGSSDWRENRGPFWLAVVARLPQGGSRDLAEERATSGLQNRLREIGDPAMPEVVATSIVPGRDADNRSLESRVSLWLGGVSMVVLLITCANVSNLVLTKVFARRRESFIRLALGESRWDRVRRSLAEASVIVVPAALGALVVAFLFQSAITGLMPGDIPISQRLLDLRTASIMSGSAALAFLLVWAVSLSQFRLIVSGTRWFAHAATTNRVDTTRRVLLGAQAGLCLMLLFVAGLFATSLRRVEALDLGAEIDRTIQITLNLAPRHRMADGSRTIHESVLDALLAHPDIEQAALAENSPYQSGRAAGPWTDDQSRDDLGTNRDPAYLSVVGAGFFTTVGSQSLRGRDFNTDDRQGAPTVAIINAPLARRLWPSENAIGQCMRLDNAPNCFEIVGVVEGVWTFSVLNRYAMAVYLPLGQVSGAAPGVLFVRPKGDARSFLPHARAIVQNVESDLPAARAILLRDIVTPELRPWSLGGAVFSAFAAVALLITAIGLYGIVAANTVVRRKEIAIRMALGANWPHVVLTVVGEGLASVVIGFLVGTVPVLLGNRWLSGLLYETSPSDTFVLTQTAFVLLTVSAVSALVPAVRAVRTNPARVLRAE